MPLLGKKDKSKKKKDPSLAEDHQGQANSVGDPPGEMSANQAKSAPNGAAATDPSQAPEGQKSVYRTPKYQFHCQLAQGSPTGVISGFTNVKQLYEQIAQTFDFDASQIMFCTLNTHKVDMNKLLGGQIALDDLIFAHIKEQPKEIEINKAEDALGLTITDNGAGYAFIKKIREGSIMHKIPEVKVGDHIEKINGKSVVPCRHYEVARMLKEIPRGSIFTIRLVEPKKSEMVNIGLPNRGGKKKGGGVKTGKATIRLKASGVEEGVVNEAEEVAVNKIDLLLETFLGVADNDLARCIYEMGDKVDDIDNNPSEFVTAIDDAFEDFGFTEEFIFDAWAAIKEARKEARNPSKNVVDINEQF
ncbi:PDZ domain-containing protein GIPC1-like [Lineus longissimus]|uniref:PDZ domain-containing protein GIPC1-like n=1 Tax=Lineus longissimus TaxID=88925 RepID=UPI002B4F35CB